jgi:hypothetical protein
VVLAVAFGRAADSSAQAYALRRGRQLLRTVSPIAMFEHLAGRAERWLKRDEPRLARRLESMPDSTLLTR